MPEASQAIIQQRVRAAAGSALFGAAIMLYFTYGGMVWLIPSEALARIAILVLAPTLKFGGWALAITGLLLLTGKRPVLAIDAAVCWVIGILLVLGGLLRLDGGGIQAVLYVLFGVMFARSGWGSRRDFTALGRLESIMNAGGVQPPTPADSFTVANSSQTPNNYLEPPPGTEADPPAAQVDPLPAPFRGEEKPQLPPQPESDPAPEGFLSQFAAPDSESREND